MLSQRQHFDTRDGLTQYELAQRGVGWRTARAAFGCEELDDDRPSRHGLWCGSKPNVVAENSRREHSGERARPSDVYSHGDLPTWTLDLRHVMDLITAVPSNIPSATDVLGFRQVRE
jgi:hypothetical protein